MANALGTNPVRDVQPIKSKTKPKVATARTGDQLRDLLGNVRASNYCQKLDLADPITVLIATGLCRSELLALRWEDFDAEVATLAISGKVIRVAKEGRKRIANAKS